jgi:hypothetical protein
MSSLARYEVMYVLIRLLKLLTDYMDMTVHTCASESLERPLV